VFNKTLSIVQQPYGAFNLENMDSHGRWLASAVDLVRFASAFDKPASCPILSQASMSTTFALPENINPVSYNPGDAYYGCGWNVRDYGSGIINAWHFGSLPGTFTELVHLMYDYSTTLTFPINWCVLFDQREDVNDPNGNTYADIDTQINKALLKVKKWPDIELFPENSPGSNAVR
jgi:hypothetical protein